MYWFLRKFVSKVGDKVRETNYVKRVITVYKCWLGNQYGDRLPLKKVGSITLNIPKTVVFYLKCTQNLHLPWFTIIACIFYSASRSKAVVDKKSLKQVTSASIEKHERFYGAFSICCHLFPYFCWRISNMRDLSFSRFMGLLQGDQK